MTMLPVGLDEDVATEDVAAEARELVAKISGFKVNAVVIIIDDQHDEQRQSKCR
jgi:hypothetical protein